VHRKCIKPKGDHDRTDLEIQCRKIQGVIRKVIGEHSYPEIMADPIVFSEPYYLLFQFRDELIEFSNSTSNPEDERTCLEPLKDFMYNSQGLKELEDVHNRQVSGGIISFKHVRLLFRPGDIVVGSDKDVKQCWMVQYTTNEKEDDKKEQSGDPFADPEEEVTKGGKLVGIYALKWTFDGKKFGPSVEKLKVLTFSGPKSIRSLEYVPLRYLPDTEREDLIGKLMDRGRRWCKLVGVSHWSYNGNYSISKLSNVTFRILTAFQELHR
jgi:hypothetical protein